MLLLKHIETSHYVYFPILFGSKGLILTFKVIFHILNKCTDKLADTRDIFSDIVFA